MKKKNIKKKCIGCKKKFIAVRKNHLYCTTRCYIKYYLRQRYKESAKHRAYMHMATNRYRNTSAGKAYVKKYNNSKKRKEYMTKYFKKNIEQHREACKNWVEKNREHYLSYQKEWRVKNKLKN